MFFSRDLDLDPMPLIYELGAEDSEDVHGYENELSGSRLSEVRASQTDRQTDGHPPQHALLRHIRRTNKNMHK